MSSSSFDETVRYHPWSLRWAWLAGVAGSVSSLAQLGQAKQLSLIQAALKKEDKVTTTILEVPSRDKGRTIKTVVYRKKGVEVGDKKPAVHLNFHGSGFIIPSLGTDGEFCATVASELEDTVVLDCDYRKAPTTPFPGFSNDAQDVLNYVTSHPDKYDVSRITVSGFSAGGTVAMGLAVTSPGIIKGVINVYGNTDMSKLYDAPESSFDYGVTVPVGMRNIFYECTFLPDQDRKDIRMSAMFAKAELWPNHILMSAGKGDSLYMPSYLVVEQLQKENEEKRLGKEIEFIPIERAGHGWDKMVWKNEEGKKKRDLLYQKGVELIKKAHSI